MAITWTIIVLGALLHDASTQNNTSTSLDTTKSTSVDTTKSTSVDTTKPNSVVPTSPTSSNPIISNLISTKPTTLNLETSTKQITTTVNPTTPTKQSITTPIPTQNPTISITTPTELSPPTLKHPTSSLLPHSTPLASLTTKEPTQQPSTSDSPQVTTQITTIQPTTTNTNASPTDSNISTKSSTLFSQDTTSSNEPATTTNKRSGTSPNNQADPSAGTANPAPEPTSTVSQGFPKQETQTTSAPITSTTLPGTTRPVNVDNKTPTSGNFTHDVFDLSHSSKGNVVHETCKKLGQNLKGNCSVTVEIQGNKLIGTFTINADQMIPTESYKPLEQKEDVITDKEPIPDTLIAILASCGALVLILCCFAAYCTYHRRSYRKNQQHLTEELQTVENGYHDNPTLEVMEIQPEMQEKKLTLNGEFNDSWIVPIDNLLKEDIPDEEDTHL
ncbi:hypothetical protein ABG768_021052 [Culter alburnus]|uniref:Podocalyxin n=1 Tax=Culter alburnus TaxID=194366 RepID=A0AAW2AQ31_CULAL